MKKILLNICLISSLALLTISCDRSLDEVNTDNSRISNPTASKLLVPIQYNMASVGYMRANDFTFDLMQSAIDFPNVANNISRYYITESSGVGYWNNSYKWLMQVKDMRDIAISTQDKNYEAIAIVLNAWIYSNLTDTFGDVPYSEASSLDEGISKPKFDKQKDIYLGLLDDLKYANSIFNTSTKLAGSDLFFNAQTSSTGVLNWKKFCNSLSLRLLNRILKRNGEVNVYERIQEIVNNPTTYPIFQSNADTAKLDITGVSPLMAPIARPQDFTTSRAVCEFFVETLKNNNDPRLSQFFSQAKNLSGVAIGYKGAPAGYATNSTFNYQPSNFNQTLATAPLKILIYPYSELQFTLAELAFKGVIAGNAQTYYQNGVKSIIEEWGAVVPANYFDNPNVAYNNTLEQIMLQKHVALFFVDQQQWFEQRRTGYPNLPNNGGLLNDGKMPQRLLYPPNPKILNTVNYQTAVQQMGGDNINIKSWWSQ